MNHYDALIIGAGIGGLTCGARLATMGYKVAIFDHHHLPGGYATCFLHNESTGFCSVKLQMPAMA